MNQAMPMGLLAVLLLCWSTPVAADANASANANANVHSCANPRAAVNTLFAFQQPAQYDLTQASRCLERTGRTQHELEAAARSLRAAYDSRGLVVPVDALSDDPEYRDDRTGESVITPHRGLAHVQLARGSDGRWRWTASSLDAVARMQQLAGRPIERVAERLPSVFHGDLFGVKAWQYLALMLVMLAALIVRKVIAFVVAGRISHLAGKLGQAWAASVIKAVASPGATIAMAIMLRVVYPAIGLPLGAAVVMAVVVRVLVVSSLVWSAYGLVDVVAERMARKAAETESKLDDQLVPLVRRMLKIIVLVAGGVFILQNLDIDVGSLLAGLGIGGLAFALAAKDTVANFFGSVMIFVDKPFQIGDWVRIGDIEGVIEEVGFRSTRVRTFYNSLITVPNAKFTESSIDNLGMRQFRRVFVTLNLTYDTTPEQMQAFVEGVRAIIQANEYTRKDSYEVHMSGFGAHSLDVMLYFFFRVSTWTEELRERHRVFLEIMRLAASLNVSFAFPTQTLHLDSVSAPGAPRKLPAPVPSESLADRVRQFGPGGEKSRPAGPVITDGYVAGSAPS